MRRHSRLLSVLGVFVALLSIVAAGCGGSSDDDSKSDTGSKNASDKTGGKLVIQSPGGSYAAAYNAAYWRPFANETGVDVQLSEGGDDPIAQLKAQVKSGNVLVDLVACGANIVSANPDLFEPVDKSIVTGAPDMVYDMIGDKYAGADVEAFPMIASRSDVFKDGAPATWADYFDTSKFPGPRGFPNVGLDSAWSMPAAALLADGVPPDQLLPLDLDRAYKKLDTIKKDIRVYWTTFGQSADILRSKEVVVNALADGRAQQLASQDVPVNLSFKDAFRFTGSWCVPKGAKNAANAWKLIQYIYSHPQQQAVFTQLSGYGPPTKAGVSAAEKLGVKDFSSKHIDEMIPDSPELLDYITKNSDELLNRFNDWVGG
jgi:spermidine/putrescine-binding protein